jgi:hypothetical protein
LDTVRIKKWARPLPGERFLQKLAEITVRYTKHNFAAAVVLEDWREANRRFALAEHNLYPYPLCGRTCVQFAYEWCDQFGFKKEEVMFSVRTRRCRKHGRGGGQNRLERWFGGSGGQGPPI